MRKLVLWNSSLLHRRCLPLAVCLAYFCTLKMEFLGTDTGILADFRARIVARMSACPATSPFSLPRARHARRSSPTCPTRALFLARMSVRDTRTYTCTVHDKLSCTRLQISSIGASLMSVSVSVSVSVPWNSSITTHTLFNRTSQPREQYKYT